MEDYLISTLALVRGSKVLCGVGHVAIHLAKGGYRVHRIDVADHHTVKARHNVKAEGLDRKATVAKGNYHHLEAFADGSFDWRIHDGNFRPCG